MPHSNFHIIFALSVVMSTTAAVRMGNNVGGASAESQNASSTAVPGTAGPGLPADFPLAPGLSACNPQASPGQVICEWHGVDGPAIYAFYHEALPKAGYTLVPGASQVPTLHEIGAVGFRKGSSQGAVLIYGSDVTIHIITGA